MSSHLINWMRPCWIEVLLDLKCLKRVVSGKAACVVDVLSSCWTQWSCYRRSRRWSPLRSPRPPHCAGLHLLRKTWWVTLPPAGWSSVSTAWCRQGFSPQVTHWLVAKQSLNALKKKILSSFIHPQVVPNTQKDVLKNDGHWL